MKRIDRFNFFLKSVSAGLLIAIAGWAFLQIDSKTIGSLVFGVGLVAVIILQANLYTGKIGYLDNKNKILGLLVMLITNIVVAFLIGLLYRAMVGYSIVMSTKLDKTWYRVLVDGIGCGACIYIAVEGYKQTKSFVPVILGVMAFILAGFEHCVADAFYYGASELTWKGLGYIGLISLGNTIGSLLIRFLQRGIIKHEEH
jgi:formate transporter